MNSRTRAYRNAIKFDNALHNSRTDGKRTGELAVASGQVVAQRMMLGAAALMDPFNADHVELGRMVPEKTKAFSQAGMTLLRWSGQVAEETAHFAASQMAAATEAAASMAKCRTPIGVVMTQGSFAMSWFAQALSHSLAMSALAMRTQRAAMAPIHSTATANARRLSR